MCNKVIQCGQQKFKHNRSAQEKVYGTKNVACEILCNPCYPLAFSSQRNEYHKDGADCLTDYIVNKVYNDSADYAVFPEELPQSNAGIVQEKLRKRYNAENQQSFYHVKN